MPLTVVSELVPNGVSGATGTCIVAGIAAAIVVLTKWSQRPNLDAIPTIGSSTWLGSWWAGIKYFTNAERVIQEGYDKYKPGPFKVATLWRWVVILSNREHLDELRNAPEDLFSMMEATNDDFNTEYIMGKDVQRNPFHASTVRLHLTRNIGVLFPDVRNEIVTAFDEILDLQGNEWKSVPALEASQTVVCRASNRLFVGLPLCRDPDYIDLNLRWTVDAIKGGVALGLFPNFLKPFVARFFTNIPAGTKRGLKHLRPIIEERQKYMEEYGKDWTDKPNDFLSWLMDVAKGPDRAPEPLVRRMLSINFAAIHTTANTFAGALFHLAAYPQYVQPLRDEVEAIVEKEGWSKASVGKMHKLDSFLKETMRMEGVDVLGLTRMAMKDYTFSDGLFLPKGTRFNAAARPLHFDEANYANPEVFDPFRFSNTHGEDEENSKNYFTTVSREFLPFGYGKHACPGRFFAANELKTMLGHVLVTYDVQLEGNATLPRSPRIGNLITAHPTAKVMFRRRAD